MATENNQLFRKTALERLSSPDLLDVRFKLVSYRTWLQIAAPMLLLIAVAAVFGTLWLTGQS